MTLLELLKRTGISGAFIADKVYLSKGAFNNKLHGRNGSRFTVLELEAIRSVLVQCGVDMVAYLNE